MHGTRVVRLWCACVCACVWCGGVCAIYVICGCTPVCACGAFVSRKTKLLSGNSLLPDGHPLDCVHERVSVFCFVVRWPQGQPGRYGKSQNPKPFLLSGTEVMSPPLGTANVGCHFDLKCVYFLQKWVCYGFLVEVNPLMLAPVSRLLARVWCISGWCLIGCVF